MRGMAGAEPSDRPDLTAGHLFSFDLEHSGIRERETTHADPPERAGIGACRFGELALHPSRTDESAARERRRGADKGAVLRISWKILRSRGQAAARALAEAVHQQKFELIEAGSGQDPIVGEIFRPHFRHAL